MERVEYKGFFIDKTKTGYRVCRCDDVEVHTHLANEKPCYKLIDNVIAKRIPTKCKCYFLECHARLTDDEKYKKKLRDYIEIKKQKGNKDYYFNSQKHGRN